MSRKKLHQLVSDEYEHEFDRKALDALEGTPGLETLVRNFYQHGIERLVRIQYTGSNIKVNKKNYPEIYEVLEEACNILNLTDIPDLYISWSYQINGLTTGVEKPIIVLSSGAVDLLSREELLFVIGHEVGHIKSQHVLYHEMARIFPIIGEIIGSATLGIGTVISKVVELSLHNWARMSEFTADRAGLLTCQDFEVAARALIKIAGMPQKYFDRINVPEFIEQAQAFESYDFNTLDKVVKIMSIMWQDHPWTVMRAAELWKWVGSGAYSEIVDSHGQVMQSVGQASIRMFCRDCGCKLKGNEMFCPKCGGKVK